MADLFVPRTSPLRPFDVDTVALLAALPPEHADGVAQLVRERDNLFVLHHALVAAERQPSLELQLLLFIEAIRQIGFGRVTITLRDAGLHPTLLVTGGLTPDEDRELRDAPASGAVWQRRLPLMERFRIGQSAYYLDGRDAWIVEEFHGGLPSALEPGDDPDWSPRDTLFLPLRAADGRVLATLSLDDPEDRRRPTMTRIRTVELFGQQVSYYIEQAQLVAVAARRAERLQRLQEVGSMLARSLDEREVVAEIARQVARLLPCDTVLVAHPDLEHARLTTALRLVRGAERPRAPQPLGAGPVAEVARTGRPVRIDDYDPAVSPLAAEDDVVGDLPPGEFPLTPFAVGTSRPSGAITIAAGGSLLAVPMMAGIRLVGVIAVHTARAGQFGAEDEEALLTVGAQAATAIVNARLYAESQRERRQSEALADVARAVGESLRLGEVLHLILRHAVALLRAQGATVALRREEYLHIVAGVGSAELLAGMHVPLAGTMSGRAVRSGQWVISNDVDRDPDVYAPTQRVADVRKVVLVPLITAQGAIGLLTVVNRDVDFTDEDARVLHRLADHVAVAIVNARLFEEVAEATREWTVAFDAVATGMAMLDEEGRVVRANARAVALLGAPDARSLAGRSFSAVLLGETPSAEAQRDAAHRQARAGDAVVGEDADALVPVIPAVANALGGGGTGRVTVGAAARGQLFDLVASPHPSGGAVVTFDDVSAQHALAARHRSVVETASDAILITDRRRCIAFANPAAAALFGRESLEGVPVEELTPAEFLDDVRMREDRAFDGMPQRYESVVQRTDGERRLVSVSTSPLRELGEITGSVASLRDITDERRARDAVTQSEARYRNLFESASDAIYTLDARGMMTSLNEATSALAGVSREALIGRSLSAFLAPDEFEIVRERFRDALGGESRRYECSLIRPDGSRRLLGVTNTPIRHGRDIVGVLGVARDVTLDRQRAAELTRSEARYTLLVESASDAIFTVDEAGALTSINRAFEETTGQSRAALLGTPFVAVVDQRDRDLMTRVLLAARRGSRHRGDFRYRGPAGDERNASLIATPILEDAGVSGVLGVVRDVTDEKRLVGQLLQQEKLAAIGQLVSGVAHELNNPLAGVMAFSQILLASPVVSGEQRAAAETIHHEARRAAKIISNLLTFARQHHPERTVADINRVLGDTLELRRYALRMQQVEVTLDLDPALPLTWADPFQLQQVVLNLIGNAEQALAAWDGERTLAISTSVRAAAPADADAPDEHAGAETIVITVRDSGAGIAAEHVARIFNPFYTTKPVGQGTGLGLSISDGIVREHGGRIRVESVPGAGATFIVELPVADPPAVLPGDGARGSGSTLAAGERPLRVLVVDDEQAIRAAVTQHLGAAGHDVDAATDAAGATALLKAARYDLVLLDLRLPDGSGDAVYEALKARDPKQAAHVVFITGDLQSESAHAFVRATGRPLLHKPFTLDRLDEHVRAVATPDDDA